MPGHSRKYPRAFPSSADFSDELLRGQNLESLGRMVGSVSHDFKNLLTVINGYCDLLLARLGPRDPSRAQVEEIGRAGQRAAALTRQLLAFIRGAPSAPRAIDLNEHIAELQPMLARLAGEEVTLVVRPGADLGAVWLDPGQADQMLVNLVDNARDAMPRGGSITIETAGADEAVTLTVSDTGEGMDEATKARLFEPFFTTKGKGTGLGLCSILGTVRQAGGRIDVSSEPGRGATFRITLPRSADAQRRTGP